MEYKLDCTSISCPLPIVQISQRMAKMELGDTLEITATDPGFKLDVEAWCATTGNTLKSMEKSQENYRVVIEKNSKGKES
jgi:tRNA 2-thiouridine synthesizing protein A